MIEQMEALFKKLGPLKAEKSPAVAAVWGFFLGGIGLGIYLLSFIDFIIPILVGFFIIYVAGDPGWFVGALVASAYGYFRVSASNEMLRGAGGPATES